jgi:hypothetical protein
MIQRFFIAGLIISFLFCYLEWGEGNSAFFFEVEFLLFSKEKGTAENFLHPAILVPFSGQLLLLYALINKKAHKAWAVTGMLLQASLVLFVLLIGIMSMNGKIVASTLPYLLFCFLYILHIRKKRGQ